VLQSGIASRGRRGDRSYTVDRCEATENAAAVAFSWTTSEGERARWSQALVIRDERIVHIQDFADPANAFRAIRRR